MSSAVTESQSSSSTNSDGVPFKALTWLIGLGLHTEGQTIILVRFNGFGDVQTLIDAGYLTLVSQPAKETKIFGLTKKGSELCSSWKELKTL